MNVITSLWVTNVFILPEKYMKLLQEEKHINAFNKSLQEMGWEMDRKMHIEHMPYPMVTDCAGCILLQSSMKIKGSKVTQDLTIMPTSNLIRWLGQSFI